MNHLYRYVYLSDLGYVVYRHFADGDVVSVAKAHKVAVFVCEIEASDYCAYRNEQTEKNGTDDVHAISR